MASAHIIGECKSYKHAHGKYHFLDVRIQIVREQPHPITREIVRPRSYVKVWGHRSYKTQQQAINSVCVYVCV